MWADQRFASERPDVLTQTLTGPLAEDLLAVGPVTVRLRFSVQPAPATGVSGAEAPAAPATLAPDASDLEGLDLDLVVKILDVAPDGTQTLVRGDVCPARWRNVASAGLEVAPPSGVRPSGSPHHPFGTVPPLSDRGCHVPQGEHLQPGVPAELTFAMASIGHRFAAGHTIALQIQSSLFPLVAMNPQTFLANPYTATVDDYIPVEFSILDGSLAF